MFEITQLIKNYLDIPNTDYAILIDGEWGKGKTFYAKHELSDFISTCEHNNDEAITAKNQNYTPIYISLNGMNSGKDLEKAVIAELNPILKKRGSKIVSSLLKGQAKKFVDEDSISTLEEEIFLNYFFGIKTIDQKNVFILDDLERINPKCLQEIFGYISMLIEHKGMKVIILAHEEKLVNQCKEEYTSIKEKVIRFTIKYNAELDKILDNLVQNYQNEMFVKQLRTNKPIIIEIFRRANCYNIRTLKFILDNFERAFETLANYSVSYPLISLSSINGTHSNEKKLKSTFPYLEVLSKRYIVFLCIYGIELKQATHISNFLYIKNLNNSSFLLEDEIHRMIHNQEVKSPHQEGIEKMYDKYLKDSTWDDDYKFYAFLENLLINGIIEHDIFQTELNEDYKNLKSKDRNNPNTLLKRLVFFEMEEDDQIEELIQSVIQFAREGKYNIDDYPNLILLLINIEQSSILTFSITDEILNMLHHGITKANRSSYISFDYLSMDQNHQLSNSQLDTYQGIVKKVEERKMGFLKTDAILKIEKIFEALDTRNHELLERDFEININQYPALHMINIDTLHKSLLATNNKTKKAFHTFIKRRFEDISNEKMKSFYSREIQFLYNFHSFLDREQSNNYGIGNKRLPSTLIFEKYDTLVSNIIREGKMISPWLFKDEAEQFTS